MEIRCRTSQIGFRRETAKRVEPPCNTKAASSKRKRGWHFGGWMALILLAAAQLNAQQPALRKVAGAVVDRSGAAVSRVEIEVRTQTAELAAATLTDAQGRFNVSLKDGRYTIDAVAPGLAPVRRQPLEVGPDTAPLRIVLEIEAIQESIVVTAMRTEAPIAQVGSSTTVIRGEELIEAGIDTLAEALRGVAGLSVAQSGATGQLASLFIRGGESDYTKVLIDGIPANDPGGSYNFANLSTSGIDRIEIVRGPQSALFGSEATAGVIQVFTRQGTGEDLHAKPQIAVEAGSYHTFRYEAGIGGKNRVLDYAASFSRMDTDNNVVNGSFNDTTANVNVGANLTENSHLRGTFRSSAGRTGVPGQWAFHAPDSDQYYRHRALSGSFRFNQSLSATWTQEFSYAIHDSRQFSEDSVDTGAYVASYRGRTAPYASYDFAYQTLNQSRRQTMGYRSDISLPHLQLATVGFEYERESGTVGDPRTDPVMAVRNNFGVFFQDQWSLHRKIFAAAGVRLDHNESFGFYAAPRLSLAWLLREPQSSAFFGLTRIKSNFGMGIKEPTLVESYSQSPFFLGNPNLRPEKSKSVDLGFEQQVLNGRGTWEITYFENRYRDQINFLTTNYSTYEGTFFNTSKSRARGVEAGVHQKLSENLDFAGTYTFTASRILENPSAYDTVLEAGQELLRRPRHSGRIDLRWHPSSWVLGATATMVGRRVDSDFSGMGFTHNPGYGVLDVVVGRRLPGGMYLFASVNNVLNRKYMEVFGYPALPARFRIGLNAGF